MKEFPLNSVVVFIPPTFAEFVGREGTIVGALGMHDTIQYGPQEGYMVDVQGCDKPMFSYHHGMRLKKFPPDLHGDCEEFMRKVLVPVEETA